MEFENVPQLLIFAPNWLGDAVMALPAIADVRRAASGATIDVLARPSIGPLFQLVPGIRRVVTSGVPRDEQYGAALLLTNSFQTALAAWRAGVPRRWGYRTDWRGALLTRAVLSPPDTVHQAACYQHLTQSLGFASGPLEPRLEASPEARRAGRDLLAASGWDGESPLVALAPGAAYGAAKRWPLSSFVDLAVSLAGDGIQSVLVGSAADMASGGFSGPAFGRRATDRSGSRASLNGRPDPIDLVGRTDLLTLAGVLVHCRALVSNDSGAMHFAAALGVHVVALFGPTDERVTRPLAREGGAAVVLTHEVWCRPCLLRECPLTHACMRGISALTVRNAIANVERRTWNVEHRTNENAQRST
jgi:heptosyltransferase-2